MSKQEQIEAMAVIGCVRNPQAHTAEECNKCDFKQGQCNAYRHAEALYNAGYGNVSEYKAERELLGSQIKVLKQRLNNKYIEIDNLNRDYHNSFERLKAQEREIMQLKAENARFENNMKNVLEIEKKQAKIDVLNELKEKCKFDGHTVAVYKNDIEEMIKEVEKQ